MKDVSKRFCKTAAAFLLSAAACLLAANDARACTAVYVGKDVSADGTTILAKSNDNQCVWPNYIDVVKRVQKKKGRKMPVDAGRTVFAEIPETTYKYVPGQRKGIEALMIDLDLRIEVPPYGVDAGVIASKNLIS